MEHPDSEIRKKFQDRARNGRITCAESLALAKELKMSTFKVAPMLTEMGIKIHRCQLGCFP